MLPHSGTSQEELETGPRGRAYTTKWATAISQGLGKGRERLGQHQCLGRMWRKGWSSCQGGAEGLVGNRKICQFFLQASLLTSLTSYNVGPWKGRPRVAWWGQDHQAMSSRLVLR